MTQAYKTISPQTAKDMMNDSCVTILDVREPMEFSSGHIPNAQNLPVGAVRHKAGEVLQNLDATILVYCLSGMRSATACSILSELGYTNVYDFGGIAAWPYEIEP